MLRRPYALRRPAPVLLLAVVVAAALAAAAPGVAADAHKPVSGKVCRVVTAAQLAAAHIEAPCVARPTKTVGGGTPVHVRLSRATWGAGATAPSWLSVIVQKPSAAPALLKELQAAFRQSVVANGPRVAVGSIGSVSTSTHAGGRHTGRLLFIADRHDVTVDLNDDSTSASPATIRAALVSIGKSVAAKL